MNRGVRVTFWVLCALQSARAGAEIFGTAGRVSGPPPFQAGPSVIIGPSIPLGPVFVMDTPFSRVSAAIAAAEHKNFKKAEEELKEVGAMLKIPNFCGGAEGAGKGAAAGGGGQAGKDHSN